MEEDKGEVPVPFSSSRGYRQLFDLDSTFAIANNSPNTA